MTAAFRRLLVLAWPFRTQMGVAALLGLATVSSSIGLLATSAYLISAAALHPSIAELQVAIVGVRFFGISRGVFRYLERLVSHSVTFRLLAHIRVWFYQALEPLAPARLLSYRSGDLLSRAVSDVETLETFFLRVLAPPAVAVAVTLGMGLFGLGFHRRLGLLLPTVLVATATLLTLFAYLWNRKLGPQLVTVRSQLRTLLIDSVQGAAELTAFGASERQLQVIQKREATYRRLQKRASLAEATQNGLGVLTTNGGMWIVLVVAVFLANAGELDPLNLATLALAALASFEAVLPLPQATQSLTENLAAAQRLLEIVDAKPAVQDPRQPEPPPNRYSLDVRDLRFHYDGQSSPALDGVSFSLPERAKLAVVGPSGAGKSTLVNLLLRFWDYSEGEIRLGGVDVRHLNGDDVRRAFGVVSQSTYLFNATVRENLLLARPNAREEELREALRQAEVLDFVLSLPKGLDTPVGEHGLRLSGGERQRLALARALLQQAPILLLDEPTANLDALTERRIFQTLQRLQRKQSLLLITHRLVGLETFDQILVLDRGRVVEQGTHQELLKMGGLYWRMWHLQHQIFEMTRPL